MEKFLDVPMTDDTYYNDINKRLPVGCCNGLAYIDDGYGTVLKIQFVKKGYGRKSNSDDDKDKDDSASQ